MKLAAFHPSVFKLSSSPLGLYLACIFIHTQAVVNEYVYEILYYLAPSYLKYIFTHTSIVLNKYLYKTSFMQLKFTKFSFSLPFLKYTITTESWIANDT